MADYIPGGDAEFNAWQQNFLSYATANAAALGLDPLVDIPPLTTGQTAWESDYPAHVTAQSTAQSARVTKDAARAGYVSLIRASVGRLQASADVDDAERAALGITVPDTDPTPTGPPTSRPVIEVRCDQRLQQTIVFRDELTPTRKAKPAGVLGAEVWVKVGDPPPVDPDTDLRFLGLDTSTPYLAIYSGSDSSQMAHYMLRWVNSKGDKGPWSETASATIGA